MSKNGLKHILNRSFKVIEFVIIRLTPPNYCKLHIPYINRYIYFYFYNIFQEF